MKQLLKIILQGWREVVGWIVIAVFAYVYLFQINDLDLLAGRRRAFEFLIAITVFILGWLKLNKKKL